MSSATKILLGIFGLIVVVLGAEAYVFFKPQLFPQTKKVSAPTPTSQITKGTTSGLIEITGSPVLLGFINLLDITKTQVGGWAQVQGIVTVPAYSGPLPTLPPSLLATISAKFSPGERPTSVLILAGYFKGMDSDGIILLQAGKNVKVALNFDSGAHFWIKNGNRIQTASLSPSSVQLIKPNDLILIPNITELSGQLKTSTIVVFR